MSKIKTLRASGTQLRADVVVGANKYGSDVTVLVQLNRADPEVAEALERLETLLSTRAQENIDTAAIERQVQERVRTEVASKTESEKARHKKLADERVNDLVSTIERYLTGPELGRSNVDAIRRVLQQAKPAAPAAKAVS